MGRLDCAQARWISWALPVTTTAFGYDGDLSLPLGWALGSPIFPSGCEGKLGLALESLQGLKGPGFLGKMADFKAGAGYGLK